MKTFNLAIFILLLSGLSAFSQKNTTLVKILGVRYDHTGTVNTSRSMDSAVVLTCVVEVLDTVNVNKIHIRISGADKKAFNSAYSIKPSEAERKRGLPYSKDSRTFYIPTIKTTQLTEYTIEACTEDLNGTLSPYISWKK